MKFTLIHLDTQGIVQEAAEDRSDVGDMPLLVPRKDQNIIQVNKDKLVQHLPEQVVDQHLEDSQSVGQAKGHYLVFVVSCWGVEGRLPLISLPDADQMLSIPQVQLGEHHCPLEQFKGGGEEWEGVAVLTRLNKH